MRVNIVTGDGIKHKYAVEDFDSAIEIVKDYAEENNLIYEGPNEPYKAIHAYKSNLISIIHFFRNTNDMKHYEGSAFIWG